ncbi:MAG: GW dipeptide domain-containing protein, partial [Tepidibacter sp.]|uniref:glycoside hydrolase family protein n=1 Tax=Tepidibacter sp. TaxID=2529387 RepID=UPI0025D6739D
TTKTTGTNGGNIVFDNLTNDTTYIIKAKTLFSISGANRDSDYVELSAKTDKIPLPSIPSAPRTEEVYEGGFKVRWGSVVSATKYRLRVRKEGDSETKDYETSNTNYSIPSGSLQYGVTYLVSVQAGNNQGWSDYSNENPLTTRAKHPTLKVIEKTSDSIKVNISGLSGNKDGVEVYLYDHRGIYVKRKTIDIIEEDIDIFDEEDIDILDEENIDTNGGNIVFDNLTSDTYIIKAKTLFSISGANRDSDYVELSVEIDNVPLPSIPSAPRTEEVYEGGFKVSWGSVASATRYRLKVRREYDSHTTYYETSDTNYSIPSGSLQYGVTHLVSVQAGNNQGWSDYSNENPLTTRAKHPTLKVIEKTSDSIKVNISGLLSNNNGVRVDLYNPKGELERTKITEKDGGNIVFIGLRGDTQYTIKAKTLFNISGVDRGSDYVELLEKTDIAPVGILKEIEDNTVYNEIMNTSEEGKWYKVKFDRNGKANFWINSAGLTNNLDLFIHAHQDLDSTKLGESIQYPGNNQADDMVLDLDVRAGVYYYIYVKNCDGGSCDFKIKTRLQAKEIQDDTVYNESINASEEGKWYRVRFDRDGKANFWINSAGLDNNLDLFIYENQDLDSSKLGESTQSDNQADDMVLNLDVRAGVYYYVYIKNCGGGSCDFKIKSKIQAKEIQNGTVYDENMSSHDKGKWYKIKFAQNGKANFWINSRELDNNLDLFIYENQDLKSTKLGESEQSDNQADDMVLDLDVRAGVYYYVYIKNQGSGSCNFKIKAKLQEEDPSWSGGDIIPPKYYVNQGLYTDIMLGSSGKSVKNAGCYISSIATIICWYLKDDRADTKEALIRQMASKCNSGGGYSNADVKYNGRTFRIDRNSDMEEKILEGLPAICEMPHHFVVVNGYDANKSGYKRFSVLDPGDRNAKTLYDSMNKSNHGFSVKSERFVYEVGGSKPPTGGKPTPGGNMDVSEKYIDFVKDYETFQEKPYRGSDKQNLTIGYGHVIKPGEHFGIMTKPEAVELLKKDLKVRIDYVNRKIKEDNLTLNQHQFDALVDFRYNKGAALSTEPGVCTLYRLIAKEKVMSGEKLMNAFLMWCKVGDEFNKGVYRRSYDEGEMFIKGDYTRNYPEKP